ncbi:MAG: DNA adenine methylase [Prevotellaceae bacterium]|nr:DNA adenine methylase [Candidatus Faecinaster equi]
MAGNNNIFRSPLRYPGGKTCIYKFMTSLLEENDMVGTSYAEPYAGGAGLALRLLMDEYVNEIFINDLDPSIYAFWYAILNNPDEMCRWIADVEISIRQWEECKVIQKEYKTVDSLDLAKSTFFLNRTNVSGVISGGPIGGLAQTGKYKIDVRFNRDDLIKRINDITNFAHRIHLSNQDGKDFLDTIEERPEDVFFYLDPPYYQKGSCLYMNAFKDKDHAALAERVRQLKSKWMVSYDSHEFILNLYSQENKVRYQLSQCASNRIGDEVIIFDERIKFENAINKLTSPQKL